MNESPHPLTTFIKDYLPAIGAVGVVLYGLFRLAYSFFYIRLRTTPEEVGYTYTRIISESVVGAVELILICATAIAAVISVCTVAAVVTPVFRRRRWPAGKDLRRVVDARMLRQTITRSVVVAAVTVFAALPCLAWWQGGLAQAGQTVRNVYFIGVPYLPVLAVQAVPAAVTWKDNGNEKSVPLRDRICLVYLGKADGTAVFYDVSTRESLRLPTGDIVVTLRYVYFAPDSCRDAARQLARTA
ncbi:MAG TPA: hypothetical protein VFG35_12640 [Actinoplanes sp.]|nr:hypothetical protein [Actinoplanes sp.]